MIASLADKIFRRASSTYYYASSFFPSKARADIFTLYAFVRTADDFVDSIPADKKSFLAIKADTADAFAGKNVSNPIVTDFVDLTKRTKIEKAWVDSFLSAMEADLHKKRYNTQKELEEYIYGSAEVIGLMMAQILQLPKASFTTAKLQGKAMQLINMVRDYKEDKQLGRSYLPGVSISDNPSPRELEDFAAKIRQYINLFDTWQDQAKVGWKFLPLRSRIAVRTAAQMYSWSAKKIFKHPTLVLTQKIKPSAQRVFREGVVTCVSEILQLSRPKFWLYLAGPFVVGWAAATSGVAPFFQVSFWLGWIYFFIPANLFLYVLNDISDQDTDIHNPKKYQQETYMTDADRRIYIVLVIISLMLTIVLPLTNNLASITLALFFMLSTGYSLWPFRFKARPVFDMLSNALYILPGIYAFTLMAGVLPDVRIIFAASMWSWSMQLFSAIPDIASDAAADLQTTAVVLGERKSLFVCTALWLTSGCFAAMVNPWFVVLSLYALIPLFVLIKKIKITNAYWRFPLINAGSGLAIFIYALLT